MADAELVNKVTEQVVRMLRQRGATITPAGPRPQVGAAATGAVGRAPAAVGATRKVFVTAEMLAQRVAGSGGGMVELACNEVLTPGAVDLVDQRRLAVRRGTAVAGSAPAGGAQDAGKVAGQTGSAIGVITYRADEKVRSLLGALCRDGVAVTDLTQGDCWLTNLRALCGAVAGGQVASGVAILPYAADAMVVAGKVKGIRPVQGTRAESVAAARRHFGANLLVLEHALSTYHQMRTMLREFVGGVRAADGAVEAAVAELERA